MKRALLLGVGVAMATTLVLGGGWATGAAATAAATDQTIRIDAVATQENFVDVAPTGPSLGDLLVVRDDWKSLSGDVVGYDGVTCTVTSLEPNGDTRLECLMTGHLPSGDLTVQGFFTEPPVEPPWPSGVLAITGGTGDYAEAAGYLVLQEVSEEETHLTFHVTDR